MDDRTHLIKSFRYPIFFVAMMWVVKGYEMITQADLSVFGNYPRKLSGITGILTSPLIHSDASHLLSNSLPIIILGSLLIYFYPTASKKVIPVIYLFTGAAVWLLARPEAYHIGASGLVYGFAFFLFFSGVFRNDMKSLVISFFTIFMYGGIVWGLLPYLIGISWESHLFGAISGSLLAFIFRYADMQPKETWLVNEETQPEISYRYIYVPKEKAVEIPPLENKASDEDGVGQS